MSTQEERDAQDTRSREGLAERVQATFDAELALVNETKLKFFNETLELKAEVKRLTTALAAANADRDRLAQLQRRSRAGEDKARALQARARSRVQVARRRARPGAVERSEVTRVDARVAVEGDGMNEDIWNWMTDQDKFDTYEDACQELRKANALLSNANAEIARLSDALAKANADRDRLAQQLGIALSEARGLRIELQRLSAPNGGVA